MVQTANFGLPRLGVARALEAAAEAYRNGEIDAAALRQAGAELRARHWRLQKDAGIDIVPSNDFSFCDRVLDMSIMAGLVGSDASAKTERPWFDTAERYVVPEFHADQEFRVASSKAIDEFNEAAALGIPTRPVLIGPVTYLSLGTSMCGAFDPIALLDRLLPVYVQVLAQLDDAGADWVQIDEPVLGGVLTAARRTAFRRAYGLLSTIGIKILVATYCGGLGANLDVVAELPIDGLHVDLVSAPRELDDVLSLWPVDRVLSLGVVDGRNAGRADLTGALAAIDIAANARGRDRLQIAPSCPLIYAPADADLDAARDPELAPWLAYAKQKLAEVIAFKDAATCSTCPAARAYC